MRAQRDEDVEVRRDRADLLEERLKHQPHRRGARGIRHDEQDPLAAIVPGRTGLRDEVGDLGGGDGGASGGEEVHSIIGQQTLSQLSCGQNLA